MIKQDEENRQKFAGMVIALFALALIGAGIYQFNGIAFVIGGFLLIVGYAVANL